MITHLSLNVQDAATTRTQHLSYSHEGRSVEVSGELGVLDECILSEEFCEFVPRDKIVVFPVLFPRTRRASGICTRGRCLVVGSKDEMISLRDTLNPNLSGNSANRR